MTPANKGHRCVRWQRVGRGRKLRCARFDIPRMPGAGFPPGHVPANRGATCSRRQRVFSPFLNKRVWRCKHFGPGLPGAARPQRGLLPPVQPKPSRGSGTFFMPPSLPPSFFRPEPRYLPAPSVIITPAPRRVIVTPAPHKKRVAARYMQPGPVQGPSRRAGSPRYRAFRFKDVPSARAR